MAGDTTAFSRPSQPPTPMTPGGPRTDPTYKSGNAGDDQLSDTGVLRRRLTPAVGPVPLDANPAMLQLLAQLRGT